jgi:hypothetical protein
LRARKKTYLWLGFPFPLWIVFTDEVKVFLVKQLLLLAFNPAALLLLATLLRPAIGFFLFIFVDNETFSDLRENPSQQFLVGEAGVQRVHTLLASSSSSSSSSSSLESSSILFLSLARGAPASSSKDSSSSSSLSSASPSIRSRIEVAILVERGSRGGMERCGETAGERDAQSAVLQDAERRGAGGEWSKNR